MRRVTILLIGLASFGLAAPPAGAGFVCARTLSIDNFHYSPATATKVAQPGIFAVCWHNDDGVNHTATSNRGLFDTDVILPGTSAGGVFYGGLVPLPLRDPRLDGGHLPCPSGGQ